MPIVSKLVLQFLKVVSLAYGIKSKTEIRCLRKRGWGDQAGDAKHWCKEQWAGPQDGLTFACFNSQPSPELKRKLTCQYFPC